MSTEERESTLEIIQSSEEEDNSDYEEEDELKKLEDSVHKEYLLDIHCEIKQINDTELQAQTKIIKDKNGKIIDPLHKTLPFLTKYEKTRILGVRTKQINNGSHIFIKLKNKVIDGYHIALEELNQKKIPFIIQRPIPNGGSEYWKVSDLELINY
tara:strand:+ start:279 stop:743 length:465 start_codon:yes stop_codon:yes gene_type:complete